MHFQRESFSKILSEALPLFESHHEEVGETFDFTFDIDADLYSKLDEAGHLLTFTIREDGKLIGYCIHHISKHLHFRKITKAVQDAIFISKEYRGIGKDFIKWIDEQLKSVGVNAVYQYVSLQNDYSKTLLGLGYHKIESTYVRRLN